MIFKSSQICKKKKTRMIYQCFWIKAKKKKKNKKMMMTSIFLINFNFLNELIIKNMGDRREREKKQLEQIYKTKNLFFKPLVVRTEGGNINLGQNNIFHVNVYLMSEGGAITIGNYNIFEDKVIILNKSKTEEMIIGSFNHFKEGAKIYNTNIG